MREDAPQREYPLRDLFNALRYMVKTGCQWRYLPNDFPLMTAVYQQARRWMRNSIQTHRERQQPLEKILRVIESIEGRTVVSKGQTLLPFGGGAVFRRLTDGELVCAEPESGWPKSHDPV